MIAVDQHHHHHHHLLPFPQERLAVDLLFALAFAFLVYPARLIPVQPLFIWLPFALLPELCFSLLDLQLVLSLAKIVHQSKLLPALLLIFTLLIVLYSLVKCAC